MKYFACFQCQQQIFFSHSVCQNCGSDLGYFAPNKEMLTLQKQDDNYWISLNKKHEKQRFKKCFNYSHYQICNWLLAADGEKIYCESCQLTHIIPPLDQAQNIEYWRRLEYAKQRFLYLMQRLNIMPQPKTTRDDPIGLWFEFLIPLYGQTVITGHAGGIITLNAAEADVVHRETTRINMGENYRTVLGHFRHESGHYYLDRMQHVFNTEFMDQFRLYFGDERQDYALALQRHYHQGAPEQWQQYYISTYASAHPWEDWAETWAHYLHMMETLETAYYAGLAVKGNGSTLNPMKFNESPIGAQDFEHILENWITLTFNLNALNRSMGLEDAYPFTLSNSVKDKLRFIHVHILQYAQTQDTKKAFSR